MKEKYEKYVTTGTGIYDLHVTRKLASILLPLMLKSNISPNLLTILNGLLGIGCACLILMGDYTFALIGASTYLVVCHTLDFIDGSLARITKKTTILGAFLDGLVDLIIELSVIFAICIYTSIIYHNQVFELIGFLIVIIGLFANYLRIRARHILGVKERFVDMDFSLKGIKNIKTFLLALTRIDMRKILILLFLSIGAPKIIIVYFLVIYMGTITKNLVKITNVSRDR